MQSQTFANDAHTQSHLSNHALKIIQIVDVMLNSFNTIASNHIFQISRLFDHVEIDPRCNDSNLQLCKITSLPMLPSKNERQCVCMV
jgi:hypothetical protein